MNNQDTTVLKHLYSMIRKKKEKQYKNIRNLAGLRPKFGPDDRLQRFYLCKPELLI